MITGCLIFLAIICVVALAIAGALIVADLGAIILFVVALVLVLILGFESKGDEPARAGESTPEKVA